MLIYCLSLLFPSCLSLLLSVSPLAANPACVSVDNKLGGGEGSSRRYGRAGFFSASRGQVGQRGLRQPGRQKRRGQLMRRHVPASRGQKPLYQPASAGSKVSGPNELFLNYCCERQTSSLGSSPSHYVINPPISPVQQRGKLLLLQFSTRSATPTTLLPFFLQAASTARLYPLSSPSPLRHNSQRGKPSNSHAGVFWGLCLGVISLTQGTVIMYFVCSSQRGGDKRAADYSPSQT